MIKVQTIKRIGIEVLTYVDEQGRLGSIQV